MIQIHADGVLAYDSRLDEYELEGLKTTAGLNKGGTAEIVMPPSHPAYDKFISHKTIVEIHRDEALLFRGRALPPRDNFHNQRTVTCEGERCFFRDGVLRPYLYVGPPANIFAAVLAEYNSQAPAERRFVLGTVTVTDPNNYIRFESENAENVDAVFNKLVERCGGYITFTTTQDGARAVNWLASLDYRTEQVIEFGENLLDFSRTGANTNPITAVLPYGAKDEETGQRITIESVNDGQDYIVDEEARALRGFICEPVVWDDVTQPTNLLRKAQGYLEQHRYIITALDLSALDLSYLDKSIDAFQVGDLVRVQSPPHNVDEDFLLTERTEDLLNPANGRITLGKDITTLTGADVAGDSNIANMLQQTTQQIRNDYTLNTQQAIQAMEREAASLIEQAAESILLKVSETYTTNGQVTEAVSTEVQLLSDSMSILFSSLYTTVDENNKDMRAHIAEQKSYIRFEDGNIILGKADAEAMTLTLENDLIIFKKNGEQFGWWDGVDFHTGNIVVEVNERAQFGNFAFVPRSNGSLSFLKVR